jgi:hypothetical protein
MSQWTDPADAPPCTAWTRRTFEAMVPFTERAVYANNLGAEGEDRVREAYGANHPRLAAAKARYDPANLFRANQNIRPLAEGSPRRAPDRSADAGGTTTWAEKGR